MLTSLLDKYVRKSPVLSYSPLVKEGSKNDWRGKPASWPDIRKNLIPNSIRLLADNRYPLGFTATVTGGYTVKIDGKLKGTYASGAQCSIPATDWPKGQINSLTAYGATEQRNLPVGYTQLEYVTFNGTQEVDTGINISTNDEIRSKLQATSAGFAYGADTSNPRITLYMSSGGNQRWGTGVSNVSGVPPLKTMLTIIQNKTSITYNGNEYNFSATTDFTTINTLTIGNCNGNTSTPKFSGDFHIMQIYQNGLLAANIIPCKNQSNVVGFYDTVREVFLTPTGTLVAGPTAVPTPDIPMDIISNNGAIKYRHQSGLPLGYTKIEYIEGDGNQYIDTGYFFDNIETETLTLDFMRTASSTGTMLYGTRTAYKNNGYAMQFTNAGATYIQWGDKDTGLGSPSAGALNTRYTTIRIGAYYSFNGADYTITDAVTPTQNYPLYLFCVNNSGTAGATSAMRIYSVVITDSNNVVKFNAIPCKNSSNVIGLYDTVSGTFMENQGTGTFTAGTAVSDPIEIYTDGTAETVEVTGKNLFDQSTATRYRTSWINSGDGFWQVMSDSSEAVTYGCYVKPNTTYTLSKKGGSRLIITGYRTKTEPSSSQATPADYKIKTDTTEIVDGSYTFTTPADCTWILFGLRQNNTTQTFPYDVQLELGSTATTYEPYVGKTATAEMLLKVGTYQDTQEVIAGNVTRNVGIKVLDGTEEWTASGNLFYAGIATDALEDTHSCYCTHFKGVATNAYASYQNEIKVGTNATQTINWTRVQIYPIVGAYSNVAAFKSWLADQYNAGTPVIVVYPLATATTETVAPQPLTGTSASVTAGSINDLQITYTQSSGGYPIDYPTGAETAHIVDIYPTTEGNNITAFYGGRVAESGTEQQGVLWAHFNLSNPIAISSAFCNLYNDPGQFRQQLLTAITAKNNKINFTNIFQAFANCVSLEYLPVLIDSDSTLSSYAAFWNCQAIQEITLKDVTISGSTLFRNCYELENIKGNVIVIPNQQTFTNCYKLKKLPAIDASTATNLTDFIVNSAALQDTVLDIREATGLTKIGTYGSSSYFMTGFKGLRVSSSAPFNNATSPQINVSYTGMDRSALVALFNDLPTVNAGQIINITGTTGANDLTADDKAIATAKGWTVTL